MLLLCSYTNVVVVVVGNTETKAATELYQLPMSVGAVPAQAVACRLYGVQPKDAAAEWSDTANELLKRLITDEQSCKVHAQLIVVVVVDYYNLNLINTISYNADYICAKVC